MRRMYQSRFTHFSDLAFHHESSRQTSFQDFSHLHADGIFKSAASLILDKKYVTNFSLSRAIVFIAARNGHVIIE